MKKKTLSIRNMCLIAIFTAIITVCAQISFNLPGGVPITLQTWGVALAGVVLGAKKGAIAAVVYAALGAAGAPVFAFGTGGIGIILGHTGGFIVAFPVLAFIAGRSAELSARKKSFVWLLAGLTVGTAVQLTAGMFWFAFVLNSTLRASFFAAVFPFILPEIAKIAAIPVVSKSINFALSKSGVSI